MTSRQPSLQADDFAGAPPGVAQDPVDGLVHRLQVGGADRPGPPGRAEQVQVRVELADHRLGQRLAELVLVGVVDGSGGGGRGRNGSGTWLISPLARPCSMTWQNW